MRLERRDWRCFDRVGQNNFVGAEIFIVRALGHLASICLFVQLASLRDGKDDWKIGFVCLCIISSEAGIEFAHLGLFLS